MLLWLLNWLAAHFDHVAGLAPLAKITSRATLAAGASFLLAVLLGRPMIAWLRARFREPIKSASPVVAELHAGKQWTPTMGGLFIVAGIVASALVCGDLTNRFVVVAILLTIALAMVGVVDDLAKLRTSARGLSARSKLVAQFGIALATAIAVYRLHAQTPRALEIAWPAGGGSVMLGWWFVPLAVVVLVGASNAVNLTDGLDGLAGGCLLFATGAMAALTYASGHSEWARYLQIAHIPGGGEMLIVAAGMLGAVLGFLWFNCFPASVFMGDTGSLPLGGLLGLLAIVCRQELAFVLVAGVFVGEAASVILQIGFYKLCGRRLLRCAPLHHHFQFLGWPENKIVVRFWIGAALAAIGGLGMMKFHARDIPATDRQDYRVARTSTEARISP
jgi:phospho-N-acetylmuramoyl-pentapeptide-transferase